MTNEEPLILVFEGASIKMLDEVTVELNHIFKGTRFDNHFLVTNHPVKGIENPYGDKLDKIIKLLTQINNRQERRQFD